MIVDKNFPGFLEGNKPPGLKTDKVNDSCLAVNLSMYSNIEWRNKLNCQR